LLDEIRSVRRDSRVLFTTFKYNQDFFENHIFPHFKNKTFPLILVDYSEYIKSALASKSKFAETKYFIEPIKIKKVFHPKIFIACSDGSLFLIVGSANLTPQGYLSNAEIITPIKIHYDEKSPNSLLLTDVKEFLRKIKQFIRSNPHKQEIDKMIRKIKDVKISGERKCWLLHNIDEPILHQVKKILGSEKVIEAIVLSSYFSSELDFYERFVSDFTKNITFIIQKRNNNLPVSELRTWKNIRNVKFRCVNFSQKERILHAKLLILKTKNHSYCLTGSANFTESGLYLSATDGNLEVCLLRKEKKRNYFDYLFKNKQFRIRKIDLDSVASVVFPEEERIEYPDFYITEVTLIGSDLIIKIDEEIKEERKALVYLGELKKEVEIDSNEIVIELSETELNELNKPCIVSIEILINGKSLKSDSKLIHNPQYFPSQYSILNSIVHLDEAYWLFSLLDKFARLPSIRYVLPVLEKMEEEGIFDETDRIAREELILKFQEKIGKIKSYPVQKGLKDLIQLFIRRHERRVKKAIKESDVRDAFNIITSFIIINKLILWMVSREIEGISYLRHILGNIRDFCDIQDHKPGERNYPDLLKKHGEEQILIDSGILYHLISVAFVVDYLQCGSPEFMKGFHEIQKRHFVKEEFEKLFFTIISLIQNITNEKLIDRRKLNEIFEEYRIFVPKYEGSAENIINRLNSILEKLVSFFPKYSTFWNSLILK